MISRNPRLISQPKHLQPRYSMSSSDPQYSQNSKFGHFEQQHLLPSYSEPRCSNLQLSPHPSRLCQLERMTDYLVIALELRRPLGSGEAPKAQLPLKSEQVQVSGVGITGSSDEVGTCRSLPGLLSRPTARRSLSLLCRRLRRLRRPRQPGVGRRPGQVPVPVRRRVRRALVRPCAGRVMPGVAAR